jgi:hypothetical protein
MGHSVLVVEDSAARRGELAVALRRHDIEALAVSSRDLADLNIDASDLAVAVVADRLKADTAKGILNRVRRWNPTCAGVVLRNDSYTAHDIAAYVASVVTAVA